MFEVFSILQLERELPKGPLILGSQNLSFVLLPWWVLILMHAWMLQDVFLWTRGIHFSPVTSSANGKQNISCSFEDLGIKNDESVTKERDCEYKTDC